MNLKQTRKDGCGRIANRLPVPKADRFEVISLASQRKPKNPPMVPLAILSPIQGGTVGYSIASTSAERVEKQATGGLSGD